MANNNDNYGGCSRPRMESEELVEWTRSKRPILPLGSRIVWPRRERAKGCRCLQLTRLAAAATRGQHLPSDPPAEAITGNREQIMLLLLTNNASCYPPNTTFRAVNRSLSRGSWNVFKNRIEFANAMQTPVSLEGGGRTRGRGLESWEW